MSETGWIHSLLQRFDTGVESLAETFPRGYLLAATVLAIAGYGWLLLFPWLVLAGISGAYEALTGQPAVAWSRLLIWSTVTAGSALITCRMARYRPTLPAGIVLDRKKATALFDLVDELGRHYRRLGIDRVVISGEFALELVKTPYCALPLWSMNTLVIGLPLIQSLSPTQFRCALARRLGQFSKRRNPLGNWLYQLRQVWPQYAIATSAQTPASSRCGGFSGFLHPSTNGSACPPPVLMNWWQTATQWRCAATRRCWTRSRPRRYADCTSRRSTGRLTGNSRHAFGKSCRNPMRAWLRCCAPGCRATGARNGS